jgi:SAM-dependent methyltransferase
MSSDARARSFGAVADAYERGRPGYPPEAIAWLLGPEPLEVADLGAGTGKLTAALVAAGHRAYAVEPLAEMRALLAARVPAATALEGRAEAIPLGDDSVDAVVAGAAFHWFAREAALAEIERVLRPGPRPTLGLLGNGFDADAAPWTRRLREVLGGSALERRGHWPEPQELEGRFGEVQVREFPHVQRIDLPGLRDLALSRSRLAVLSEEERRPLLEAIDRLWEREIAAPDTELPYRTRVMRCSRCC